MKSRIIIVICAFVIVGYFSYGYLLKEDANTDEQDVRSSFQAMSFAITTNNPAAIKNMLSPSFSDKKIARDELMKVFALKRETYSTKIQSIKTQGDLASIFYTRTESRGVGGAPFTVQVKGETWKRKKDNPVIWLLDKLAVNDKWFRTTEAPAPKGKVVAKKESRVLGSLEKKSGGRRSMLAGAGYSPVGRRDPFRSLIALEMEVELGGKEVCDPDRPRELLESYDLLSLKLAGVIRAGSERAALIEAPDGKGYTVRSGMYIGKRCGRILGIEGDFMLVNEQIPKVGADSGVYEPIETTLKLRPEEG